MTGSDETAERVEELLDVPHLADALESEQFRHFLDQIPIAIAVSDLKGPEHIVYANPEFEKLSGQSAAELEGKLWSALNGQRDAGDLGGELGVAVVEASDCVGTSTSKPPGVNRRSLMPIPTSSRMMAGHPLSDLLPSWMSLRTRR